MSEGPQPQQYYGSVSAPSPPQGTGHIAFSDAEIKKHLSDKGFPTTATTTTTDDDPVALVSVEISNATNLSNDDDNRLRALQKELNRGRANLAFFLFAMFVGLLLSIAGQWDILTLWMLVMVPTQSILFGLACMCCIVEYSVRHKFTQLADNNGYAKVLQCVSRRGWLQCRTYHLLVRYKAQGRAFLKIVRVTKAEYDWTKPGDVVTPLKYIPYRPKTAVAVRPRHARIRRCIMLAGIVCTVLHFASLAVWIVQDGSTNQNPDNGKEKNDTPWVENKEPNDNSSSDQDDDDPWFFLFLTFGIMGFAFLLLFAKILALVRLKLEDFVTVHEATLVTLDDHPTLPKAKPNESHVAHERVDDPEKQIERI